MKLVKSLLLGSVAYLIAAAAAPATELAVPDSAPIEYVRVCDVYGAGFFFFPEPTLVSRSAA